MKHAVYNTTLHMVEIERATEISLSSIPEDVWHWEIILCTNESANKGKAFEQSRNAKVPWMDLKSDPLGEMIAECKRLMK